MSNHIDPETIDLEQLRQLANEELQQPRDEQGRFVSSEREQASSEQEQSQEVVEQPDEIVYRRVIDLGDGSGTQVFEGATPEDLIEKLATAQTHATRKIRELSQAQKPAPEPVIDENEEFVLSQEFLQSPTKGFEKLFQKMTGMKLDEFKSKQAKIDAFQQAQSEYTAAQEFVRSTPDYYPTERNGLKLEKWCRLNGLEGTVENIQKAYADLSESGLLETKTAAQDAGTTDTRVAQPRIAESTTRVVGQRRAASGLSSRGGTSAAVSVGPTEEELYNMPLEKLKELALKANQ